MQTDSGTFSIHRRRLDHADGVALIAQVQEEYAVRYGNPDVAPIDPAQFEDPEGAFFVGYLGDHPVAMGGWRWHEVPPDVDSPNAVEVKRMYVIPEMRCRGFARAVLAHLEATASSAGSGAIVLETGMRQPEAISLYESSGYRLIGGFGYYAESPLARCYAKALDIDAAHSVP